MSDTTFRVTDGTLEGNPLKDRVDAAFKIVLEKVAEAQRLDKVRAEYEGACEAVSEAAAVFDKALAEAGVAAEYGWESFGMDASFDPDGYYGAWVVGANLAQTWVPSSIGC